MACCCQAWCTTRHYDNLGAAQWQAPGDDPEGSNRLDIDVDSSNNVYTVFSGVEKINSSGTRVYITPLDGRFGHRTLRCIAVEADGSYGYVGTSHVCATAFSPGYTGDNVYKVDLSDGSVVASASVGTCAAEINDACLDGNGGVYFGHTEGVAHFNSAFTRLDDVGCAVEVLAVCIDDEDNLWTAGAACEVTIDGCPIDWTVRKYNSSGTLLDGHVFQGARAIAWYNGHVYVGFRETNDSSPCNIVKITDDTLECVWSFGIGALYGDSPSQARDVVYDIAANANGVYAVADKYLFQLADADGSLNWCRKNEGSKPDTTKVSKRLHAVAVASSKVWVVGGATPCNDDEEDACSSGSCQNKYCDCICGTRGRNGGIIVGCDCDEVPCNPMGYATWDECLTNAEWPTSWEWGLGIPIRDGSGTQWNFITPDDPADAVEWRYTFNWTCNDADGLPAIAEVLFRARYTCATDTWEWFISSTTVSGVFPAVTYDVTVTDQWCADDGPTGYPGANATVQVNTTEPGGESTCCAGAGCVSMGQEEPSCGVDLCGCTGIPETLSYSVTGCYTASGTLTFNGTDTWADTTGFDCGGVGNLLPLIRCNAGSWEGEIGRQAIIGLIPCTWLDTAPSVTCSPFELIATGSASSGCPCCGGGGSVTLTVTG